MRLLFVGCIFTSLLAGTPVFAETGKIKIGVLNDQNGLYSDSSGIGSVLAAKMAAEDFGGSVNGATIEIVSADHQNKADIGASIARRWYENEQVDAIADVPVSSVALAVQEVARQQRRIVLNEAATADLSGKACSPVSTQWGSDTYSLSVGPVRTVVEGGGDTWFFLSADYAFGKALEKDASAAVDRAGGRVVGRVAAPLSTPDFSSFLLQAQASKAKVIGLAIAGGDMINAIKQATEFGLTAGGTKIVSFLLYVTDVNALGLQAAQGLLATDSFYWDQKFPANGQSGSRRQRARCPRRSRPRYTLPSRII